MAALAPHALFATLKRVLLFIAVDWRRSSIIEEHHIIHISVILTPILYNGRRQSRQESRIKCSDMHLKRVHRNSEG